MSRKPPDHDRKLAEIAAHKSRFDVPRWRTCGMNATGERSPRRGPQAGTDGNQADYDGMPLIVPKHLAPTWSPLSRPTSEMRSKRVDMILDRLR